MNRYKWRKLRALDVKINMLNDKIDMILLIMKKEEVSETLDRYKKKVYDK